LTIASSPVLEEEAVVHEIIKQTCLGAFALKLGHERGERLPAPAPPSTTTLLVATPTSKFLTVTSDR
jgi:hypothetical protein